MDGPTGRAQRRAVLKQGAVAAASGARAAWPDQPPAYLAPKRARRGYGDRGAAHALRQGSSPMGAPPTLVHALEAMLNAHALDWSRTQLRNCRGYLLSPTGRFQSWCQALGIVSVDDLTTERVAAYLAAVADRDHGPGLKASTISRFRTHLRAFAHFQAETPGYGTGLHDIGRIRAPRMPREQFPVALSRDEEWRIVDACTTTRDRLIIELFLATGLRVSEMAALTLSSLRFSARPPRLAVTGSVHDPDCTKNCRPRNVAFRKSYNSLPGRLLDWIQTERDPQGRSSRQEVFLAAGDGHRAQRLPEALTIWGYESLCQRVSLRAGIHFSPHVLRHTWATRLVDARVTPLHMMEVGGWSSIDMVSRYYTANDDEVLAAIAAASA
jgi:integrase